MNLLCQHEIVFRLGNLGQRVGCNSSSGLSNLQNEIGWWPMHDERSAPTPDYAAGACRREGSVLVHAGAPASAPPLPLGLSLTACVAG